MRIDYLIDYMLAKNARIRGSSSKRKKGGKSKDHGRQPKTKSINDLPRARRVGSGSHDHHKGNAKLLSTSKPRSHGSPSGGYKLNIVRPGQGHGKQTLLSFTKTRKSRTRDDHVQRHPGYEGRGGSDDEAADDADDEDVEMLSVEDKFEDEAHQLSKKDDQKLTWKQRLKKRKEAERMHGVYTHIAEPGTRLRANAGDQVPFESGSKRISSTSRKRNSGKQRKKSNRKDLVWDMEQDDNDDLRQALAPPPSSQPRVNSSSAPKRVSVPHPLNNKDTIGANLEPKQGSESRSHVVRTDSDFALLLPGRTFGSKTYIKRGMLYELIQIMQPANTSASTPAPILHPKYNAPHLPITFSLSNPLSDFLRDLPILCEHLGEFVTGLPDMDEERVGREWRITMRGVEEVLTGFLKGEMNDIDLQKVHNTVENALKGLILQMGAADFTKMTIDVMTLDVAWFAVELGVRAGFRLPSSNLLLDASKLLVGLLLGVDSGLKGAMVQMRDLTRELNDLNSVVQRGAELWVFLIFVLGPKGNHRSPDESHPLWDIVTAELERSTSVAQWSLVSTDAIWQTISNLCALSQFSEHGLCKEKPTIPEHWKIVHFALKSARLQIDPDNERDLSPATLRTKDRYTKLIVTRCFFLVTRWGWTVENDILDKLSKMFMSRKYRNLEHEDADFPEFLRTQRWESCFDYSKRDSAFVLFLKLAVQRKHIVTRSGKPERFIDNQLKKLLSFITPMGSLVSFSKANPAQGNELSMLYNRMAATAVGLHLLPSEYRAKVQQARKYIDFVKSDDTSRVACIRSLMYLSQMIVLEKLPLADTEVNPWYKDIVDVLIKEYKTLSTNAHGDSLNRVMLLLTLVPGSLRHILNAYNDPETGPQYPDLSLLDVIQRIGNDSSIMENINTAQEVEKVLRTFLSIRDKIIPAPQLPPLEPLLENNTDEDLHESQGCYGDMDIDIDDPTVLALLAGDINEPSSTERMDSKKAKVLSPLTGLVPSSGFLGLVDRWIDTWLQFASVAMTHSQNMTWTSLCLDGRNTWEKDGNIDFACRRRIDLRVAFNILTRTPMSYQDDKLKYYFIETLFYALVPGQVTIQHDFVSWLLSIDGLRHSLLRKLPVLLPPRPEIHTFSIEDFVSVREQLLGGILDNIEHSLHDEENNTGIRTVLGESPTNKRYAEFLVNYLTTLKETWMNLPHGSKERQDYEHKCKEITKLIYETHSRIGTLARLGKWDVWRRGLD
ncbi:Mus7/MMS22 family-domain-containing protein [Rhodocollybia butyracea]|uniref:Mus7/MMS22 family-domain-containing protein n=1 Tax=Rhodocollybia butyracea TaxID=206335 RepID=A0A9P5QA13_9AGAR|nr:Mus7/MMS22 family-domain-containing protein [Rhodocollybia butyracea]